MSINYDITRSRRTQTVDNNISLDDLQVISKNLFPIKYIIRKQIISKINHEILKKCLLEQEQEKNAHCYFV